MLGIAHFLMLGTVENIEFRSLGKPLFDKSVLHKILYQLHIRNGIFGLISANRQFLKHFLHDVPGDLFTGSSGGF